MLPCFHHASSSSTAGSAQVVVLLNSAAANSGTGGAIHAPVDSAGPRRLDRSPSPAERAGARVHTHSPDRTFLRSVIHATDSTWIGCTAKIAAAIQAPGTRSRRSSCHNSTAFSRVQQDVDEVVAQRLQPPQVVLDPEGREGERIVLRHGSWARARSAAGRRRSAMRGLSVTYSASSHTNPARAAGRKAMTATAARSSPAAMRPRRLAAASIEPR